MRYEIIVDEVARICVWRTRQHFGVMHEALDISASLRCQIDDWIDRHIEILRQPQDDPETYAAWLDYDQEGREIAKLLKPALGENAQVDYFCEAIQEYEPII